MLQTQWTVVSEIWDESRVQRCAVQGLYMCSAAFENQEYNEITSKNLQYRKFEEKNVTQVEVQRAVSTILPKNTLSDRTLSTGMHDNKHAKQSCSTVHCQQKKLADNVILLK